MEASIASTNGGEDEEEKQLCWTAFFEVCIRIYLLLDVEPKMKA
jgi:hypothetical protein